MPPPALTDHPRSLIGAPSLRGPAAHTHSRFRGSAVIPFDQAGAAQVDEMLEQATHAGLEIPRPFRLDAIQVFYSAAPSRDSEIEEVRVAGWDGRGIPWTAPGRRPLLAWRGDEPTLLPSDRGRRHFSAVALDGSPPMLALLWDVTGLGASSDAAIPAIVRTPSSALYVALRSELARGSDIADESAAGRLETSRWTGRLRRRASVPVDTAADPNSTSSDLDADVLDATLALWLQRARSDEQTVAIEIDEILRLRGLQPKRNAAGHGAGFHPAQRRRIVEALERLLALELVPDALPDDPDESTVPTRDAPRGPVLISAGRHDRDASDTVSAIVLRPGPPLQPLLGRGRQVAWMARQVLAYDPYRRSIEKRLGRYLAWQWRIRARAGDYLRPLRVDTLLRAVDLDAALSRGRRPAVVRDRLESALDQLVDDAVLAAWHYERWREPATGRPRWLAHWREAPVVLEPPPEIPDAYRSLERRRRRGPRPVPSSLGRRLAVRRRRDALTQAAVAAQLGVSRAHIAALETGRRAPSATLAERLEAWLDSPSA
ncbi:MAG: helix-turn-helix transcriptional regulator [Acidobacteriota bacterium]